METAHDQENWRSLHERLRGIARRRAALDAEEARCLREAHVVKLWRQLGYAHMNEYLERELGYSPQVGIERLRVAHALADLPQIEASLDACQLAFSAVRELTRVATPRPSKTGSTRFAARTCGRSRRWCPARNAGTGPRIRATRT
jgi:hypothetical protein